MSYHNDIANFPPQHAKVARTGRLKRTLVYVRHVAEVVRRLGSQTAAARELNLDTSTVNHLLRDLPEEERNTLPKGKAGGRVGQPTFGINGGPKDGMSLEQQVLARLTVVLKEKNWVKAEEIVRAAREFYTAKASRKKMAEEMLPPSECPISALPFSPPIVEFCNRRGIQYVAELLKYSEADLAAFPRIGAERVREIRLILNEAGYAPLGRFHAPAEKPAPQKFSQADLELAEGELAAAEAKAGRWRAMVDAMRSQLGKKA